MKRVGPSIYLHVDAIPCLDEATRARVEDAEALAGARRGERYNLVRLDRDGATIALLHYPGFFDDPFPALVERWLVDPGQATVDYRTYADSLNPPILHRKELLLPPAHPRREEYAALTAAAESIGLFDQTTRIGYRRQWLALVREKGYRIDGHRLAPLGNVDEDGAEGESAEAALHAGWEAARQRTAMVRYGFSAPVQTLARYGFLDGRYRLFDYGCGRGDDVRGLRENGLEAAGWDPFYASEQPLQSADIVNLGFVVNVIEDFDERVEALTRAYTLAQRLLVVSVMIGNANRPAGECFRDGVLTRRGTFQKYYSQEEIKAFIQAALDQEPIPVAPGVLYVFRDKDAEQRFLLDRYRSRRNVLRVHAAPPREPPARPRRDRMAARYAEYRGPLDRLWGRWLALGRRPDKSEVGEDLLPLVEGFGSLGKALRFIQRCKGEEAEEALERAREARVADLEVYFALTQFEGRKPYAHLERGLQRDIKAFFGEYAHARLGARELLFRIADPEALGAACRTAAEHGLGWLEEGKSLQLHAELVEQLPPLLRIYVGCAAVLYGDYANADLVKIHIASGKLSLMRFDDFSGRPLPRMVERVKIKLRQQHIEYYSYGEEYAPPFLYHKSRYINEEFAHYPDQAAFDEALEGLGWLDLSGHGPPPADFLRTLEDHRWAIEGFRLVRASSLPSLDAPCGRYFRFRDLVQCGETQADTGLANLPKQAQSYNALYDLATRVLDPVIDYFGMVRLTYGFCSPELARRIPGRIDPKRDQHAAHERNRLGRTVCPRLGAAVDFIVEDEDMLEVAQWVVANTPFDRLYFYAADKPIHVSVGPNDDRQVVRMVSSASGRLLPRVMAVEGFLALTRHKVAKKGA